MTTHGELREQVIKTSLSMIDESRHGETTGEDVARELGIDITDNEARSALYDTFFAVKDTYLDCSFPGGMVLPYRVRRR
jgi:hypothetical protein